MSLTSTSGLHGAATLGWRLLLLALWTPAPAPAEPPDAQRTRTLSVHRAPEVEGVSEANLLDAERFWPYQVALAGSWQPPGGGRPLGPDSTGVLIRVEPSGRARIDFGRDGLYEVPVGETDLVERANRVRRGELEKLAPNLALALGPRLLDPTGPALRPFPFEEAVAQRHFLCVFADPSAGDFAELASALAPLGARDGLLTILFPLGEHPDAPLRERLRSLGWTAPFLHDHLTEAYAGTLLAPGSQPPFLQLATAEGRVLYQAPFAQGAVQALASALDATAAGRAAAAEAQTRAKR